MNPRVAAGARGTGRPSADPGAPADRRAVVAVPGPLDLAATVGSGAFGRADPTCWRSPDHVVVARRFPAGPATIELTRLADAGAGPTVTLLVQAWGAGADDALDAVPAMVGAHDRPERFAPEHHELRRLGRRWPGWRFARAGRPSDLVAGVVVGQRVTGGEAVRQWSALARRFGDPAPGPWSGRGLWLPPSPERLAALPYPVLHQLGIERRRAEAIRSTARVARWIDAVAEGDPADAVVELQRVAGVGPWTATSLVQLAWGAADVPIVGDLHLPHLVTWALAGHRRGTDEEMLDLLAPFGGHRARVVRLLGRAGAHPPRRAPRARVEDIRGR